jgi:outer membrane protein
VKAESGSLPWVDHFKRTKAGSSTRRGSIQTFYETIKLKRQSIKKLEGTNMRFFKIIFAVIFISTFVFILSSNAADVAKIGVVDFQRVLDNSNAGKSAQAEITRQGKKMEAELEKRKNEIEEIQKNIERQNAVMSKEAREEKKRELQIKIYDIKNLEKKYLSELRKNERKKLIKIQNEAFSITQEIGKKEGYLIIFEKKVAIYVPKTLDLTDKVIQEYNAVYKK